MIETGDHHRATVGRDEIAEAGATFETGMGLLGRDELDRRGERTARRGDRKVRVVDRALVVQHREEHVEHELAGRAALQVAPQVLGDVLEQARRRGVEIGLPGLREHPAPKPERRRVVGPGQRRDPGDVAHRDRAITQSVEISASGADRSTGLALDFGVRTRSMSPPCA